MAGTESEIEADYVVIGAGSAGCVLASRLSEDGARVVLLEAGPTDWHPMIHVPAGVLKLLYNPLVNWNYATDPEPGAAGRQIHWPRGRVLGGSSSINGMLWIRGNPADYDGWSQMGCKGWSFDEVMPHFKSIERYAPGDAEHRGKSGPILVEDYRTTLDLTHRFVEAAQQAGIPLTRDLNGSQKEGVGYSQMSRNGRFRGSTARTFLAQAKGRPNLRIETNAFATRLLFDGKRCTGVAFRQKGQDRKVTAAREVILSGGTINSPHLLQVSGVGPGAHLKSIGVDVVHDLSGVWQQPVRPLRGPHLASGQGRGVDQRAGARAAAGARGRPLADDGTRRADLRRVERAGVRPQPRGPRQPRHPAAVLAGELRPEQVRGAGARARHDGRGQHRPAREPRHDHGEVGGPLRAPVAQAQLPLRAQRHAGGAGGDRADAARVRGARHGPAQRGRDHARPGCRRASRRWATTCASRARRSITSSAPAGWARTRWPWSMPGCGCVGLQGCA